MSNITAKVHPDIIINEETQPMDGFSVSLHESASDELLTICYYDHSWDVDDAIEDALSGC
jgi:hypothetical protein